MTKLIAALLIGLALLTVVMPLLFVLFSMVVVGGEQFGWWEWGWVADPNDGAC